MGTLYLVSTPIGNLEDITLRALRVLREASLIAAENPRYMQRLLDHYEIQTPCVAYHAYHKLARLDDVMAALAQGDVALVADAGTPGMSNLGFELINACIAAGFTVTPIPGPSTPIAALAASGLIADTFTYIGYLPRRGAERRALLQSLADAPRTLICFEAPHRLLDALTDLLIIFGDRRVVIAHDLTKAQEYFRRERLSQAIVYVQQHRPRSEYTILVEGRIWATTNRKVDDMTPFDTEPALFDATDTLPSEAEVAARLCSLRDQGKSGSAAARLVARELGLNKSLVYQVWIGLGTAKTED